MRRKGRREAAESSALLTCPTKGLETPALRVLHDADESGTCVPCSWPPLAKTNFLSGAGQAVREHHPAYSGGAMAKGRCGVYALMRWNWLTWSVREIRDEK